MKKRIFAVLAMAVVLAACNTDVPPADITQPITDLATDPATDPVTDPATDPITDPVTDPVTDPDTDPSDAASAWDNDSFEVVLGDPVVVYQGQEGDQGWGKHQFPSIYRTRGGYLRVHWNYGEDRVGAKNRGFARISIDGGKRWFAGDDTVAYKRYPLANGKYFLGFRGYGTVTGVNYSHYIPKATWNDGQSKLYYGPDLVKDDSIQAKNVFTMLARIYNPTTGQVEEHEATVNWPHMPVNLYNGKDTYTISGLFNLSGNNYVCTEDTIYTCIYSIGFDSTAETEEEAMLGYYTKHHVYVFSSEDCGITWNFLSQINADQIGTTPDGVCEPKMIQMPDGSMFMLLRTGSMSPLLWVRSTDGCKTWSNPRLFNSFGVLPQLLTLDCGVTIATYGRPKMHIRATADPSGMTWQQPQEIEITGKSEDPFQNSCYYTGLLAIDEDTALMTYTDFHYPNRNGVGVRTVLVREVHIVKKK